MAAVQAALEEFQEELQDAIEQPTAQEEIASDEQGEELGEQSTLIDSDSAAMGEHIGQVGAVAERIEEAPGEMDAPLDPAVKAGAEIALESLNVALESEEGETKEGVLAKLWRYIKQAFEVVRKFGRRVVEFVQTAYAFVTDRAVRNKRRAEKIKKDLNEKQYNRKNEKTRSFSKAGNWGRDVRLSPGEFEKYVSPRVRKILNGANAVSVEKGMNNLIGFLKAQVRISGKKERIYVGGALGLIASDPERCDAIAKEVLESLEALSTPGFKESSSGDMRKALAAGEGVTVRVSEPFLAGYRAFVKVPGSINTLGQWGCGISRLDTVVTRERFEIPEVDLLTTYVDQCLEVSNLIADSTKHSDEMKSIDSVLAKEIKETTSNKAMKDISSSHVRTVITALQTVIPRAIKGPVVDVLRMATEFSSSLLDYVQACRSAYEAADGATGKEGDWAKNSTTFGLK